MNTIGHSKRSLLQRAWATPYTGQSYIFHQREWKTTSNVFAVNNNYTRSIYWLSHPLKWLQWARGADFFSINLKNYVIDNLRDYYYTSINRVHNITINCTKSIDCTYGGTRTLILIWLGIYTFPIIFMTCISVFCTSSPLMFTFDLSVFFINVASQCFFILFACTDSILSSSTFSDVLLLQEYIDYCKYEVYRTGIWINFALSWMPCIITGPILWQN